MRILAIETSGRVGSVALLSEGRLLEERQLPKSQRTASSLAPTIQELLRQVGWRPNDVQITAVTTGPGSFTGLRLGVTTAKAFAYAAETRLIGIHTLTTIAHRAPQPFPRLHVAIPAERKQVFAGLCAQDGQGSATWVCPTQIVDIEDWLAAMQPGDHVTGSVLQTQVAHLPPETTPLPASYWQPTAGAVGELAVLQYRPGTEDDPLQLVPNYYRKSAAEEKRSP